MSVSEKDQAGGGMQRARRAQREFFGVVVALLVAAGGLGAQTARRAAHAESIILATTTSTQDSGLLDALVPLFTRQRHIKVKVIAVGTGAALEMARRGDADAVLAHAPQAERKYVESGDLVNGRLIMHNDFLIVGPAKDPAGIKGVRGISAVMHRLATHGRFVSRGDASGTEKMEFSLWKAAGIDPKSVVHREETGQGMGATLRIADEHAAYTLTDRATYLALKTSLELVPMVEGHPELLNVYHAYVVNAARHPKVKTRAATAFVDFLTAKPTQRLIGEFGRARFGQSLFVPDAGKPEPQLLK